MPRTYTQSEMTDRNHKINQLELDIISLEADIKKKNDVIKELKGTCWRSNIGWAIGGFIFGLGLLGIVNSIH